MVRDWGKNKQEESHQGFSSFLEVTLIQQYSNSLAPAESESTTSGYWRLCLLKHTSIDRFADWS